MHADSDDEEDQMIMVVGLPCGGTSMVAGVLHHLGVYMGMMPGRGPYSTDRETGCFECQYFGRVLSAIWAWPEPQPHNLDIVDDRVREYVYKCQGEGHRPYGAKNPRSAILSECSILEQLPLRFLEVDRPLEDVLKSWERRWSNGRLPPDVGRFCGALWVHKRRLFHRVSPTLRVDFYDFLKEPEEYIDKIVKAFCLTPLKEQLEAARRFVDPQKRHI